MHGFWWLAGAAAVMASTACGANDADAPTGGSSHAGSERKGGDDDEKDDDDGPSRDPIKDMVDDITPRRLGTCVTPTLDSYEATLTTGIFDVVGGTSHVISAWPSPKEPDRKLGPDLTGHFWLSLSENVGPLEGGAKVGSYTIGPKERGLSAYLEVHKKGRDDQGSYAAVEGTLVLETVDEQRQQITGHLDNAVFKELDEFRVVDDGCVTRVERIDFTIRKGS